MATLKVKNVGPIRDAELDVKKHTIFIGPQGSGKSTLAKLIAIGTGFNMWTLGRKDNVQLYENYSIQGYISDDSEWQLIDGIYKVSYKNLFDIDLTEKGYTIDQFVLDQYNRENGANSGGFRFYRNETLGIGPSHYHNMRAYTKNYLGSHNSPHLLRNDAVYIPTERMVASTLSNAVWGLLYTGTSVPKIISMFGSIIENSKQVLNDLFIPFLNINYVKVENTDYIKMKNGFQLQLNQAASGYQAVVPLLQVVETTRTKTKARFIVEEPELNLYPTTQKDLIYALVSGLNPDQKYHDAEWVITTHSPYVLSAYNTLMLAYKVAQKSDDLRTEVAKIIPERCWINPDDFAAYYVDEGTVRSIINPKTGLIKDNELDDVSEQFAAEQDQLLELNRSVHRD